MKIKGQLYNQRQVARLLGNTDTRTVAKDIYKLRIRHWEVGNAIVIDDAGLARLREHYAEKRRVAVPA